ncbi:GrpB family protein [Thalassobacillus sp. CUG 92003]|uniref:GrpB family protein n=1 Tax=Thalassobacillus sp. CUG 92003 TaxID=2736641 RepID=UPI0015E6D775|nr:GrpB family protein [Thalassobacillus sp. CUG 92003]
MRKVDVRSHDSNWKIMFNEEAQRLREVVGDEIIAIHHIGSTAVDGLKAKPVIDLMPEVQCIDAIDDYNEAMRELGYEPMGENGLSGRRFFKKGGDQRSHHLHMYETGHPDVHRHLAFRDYLRIHLKEARRYGDLKAALAQRHPYDMEAYITGKEALVLEIERKALAWST